MSSDQRSCHFFSKLPVDLQIQVVQPWLAMEDDERGLIKALVTFDIACCGRVLRGQLLDLNGRVAFTQPAEERACVSNDLRSYMKWLHFRCLSVRCLVVTADNSQLLMHSDQNQKLPFTLPSVQHLMLNDFANFAFLPVLISCCPNILSVETGVEDDGRVWRHVFKMRLNLKRVQIHYIGSNTESVRQSLSFLPPSVEELRVPDCPLNAELVALWCDQQRLVSIKNLTVNLNDDPAVDLLSYKLTGACPVLETLTISGINACVQGDCRIIVERLLALPSMQNHLKSLTICSNDLFREDFPYNYNVFITSLEQHVWLDDISVEICRYKRSTAELTLQINAHLTIFDIGNILDACPSVTSLRLVVCLNERITKLSTIFELLANGLGRGLLKLYAGCGGFSHEQLLLITSRCPALKALHVDTHYFYCDGSLRRLAQSCPLLEDIGVDKGFREYFSGMDVSDVGMIELFSKCSHLKRVSIPFGGKVTFKTLQAIVDNRLLLEKLRCWKHSIISREDVEKYRKLAFEHQLLPVARIY